MNSLRLFLASAAAAFGLTACQANPKDIADAFAQNYSHCERTVTYTAAVGPLNPASGATINGTIRCAPQTAGVELFGQ